MSVGSPRDLAGHSRGGSHGGRFPRHFAERSRGQSHCGSIPHPEAPALPSLAGLAVGVARAVAVVAAVAVVTAMS